MDKAPSDKPTKLYQNSEVIFEEATTGNEMYIIRSGQVKLVLEATGQGVEVGSLGPGEYFGEMALVDDSPRAATAIAEEDNTELEVLDRQGFLDMIKDFPEFGLDIMRALSERVRQGNLLYLEVIKEAMSPFCRQNCLKKTLDAFVRASMSRLSGEPGEKVAAGPKMEKWKCNSCDYVYVPEYGDPRNGIDPGTPFEDLPDTWECPSCGVPKSMFQKIES